MIPQLRSELLKQRTTRTTVVLLAWMVGLVVLVVALHVISFGAGDLSRNSNQMKILGLGTSIGALFASLLARCRSPLSSVPAQSAPPSSSRHAA